MKFLVDEDLSPKVAERLRVDDGLDVVHIRDRGLLGALDPSVLQRAYEEDRILVTANVRDFHRLARARELHPGIVLVLDGALSRDEQLTHSNRFSILLYGMKVSYDIRRIPTSRSPIPA
ncbi:MAG: DUF5615 family PIN-like protein [Caldilineaceae bacterium]